MDKAFSATTGAYKGTISGVVSLLCTYVALTAILSFGIKLLGGNVARFVKSFTVVFFISEICYMFGANAHIAAMPDAQAKAYLETVRDAKAALFGTLGAWPDSDHARDCIAQGEALVNAPERRNKVLGTYLCQGKVDPKIVAMMQKMASDVHPMTPERKARLEEAAKHPDEADCLRAQEAFKGFAEQVA